MMIWGEATRRPHENVQVGCVADACHIIYSSSHGIQRWTTLWSHNSMYNTTKSQSRHVTVQCFDINSIICDAEMTHWALPPLTGHTPTSFRISSISDRDIRLPAPMFWRTFSMPSAETVAWALYWRDDDAALTMSCLNLRGSSIA